MKNQIILFALAIGASTLIVTAQEGRPAAGGPPGGPGGPGGGGPELGGPGAGAPGEEARTQRPPLEK